MEKKYEYDFQDKSGMLKKLQNYAFNPDDDNIRLKDRIRQMLLHCPELLYALHNKDLETELFDENGKLNVDTDGEPLGEWDSYFGNNGSIRPFLFIPETQTEVTNYLCYQVSFQELAQYNKIEKYCLITFNIFVNGKDSIDKLTGVPRHDLIASIIREKMAWSGITSSNAIPVSDKETTTDNKYIVRTLVFQALMPNAISTTKNGFTQYTNKGKV